MSSSHKLENYCFIIANTKYNTLEIAGIYPK